MITNGPSRREGFLPPLHQAQIEIAVSPARFKVLAAGRRFGKGVLGVAAAFRAASTGKFCRWISPTYASDSYQSGWRLAATLAAQIQGVQVRLQKREFDFSTIRGGWLQFRTAEEPDSLRGEGIDFVIFDEAAHIPALQETWEQCVRPSLLDRRGEAWFISTPYGFNYFNELFLRSRHRGDWSSFQFPTSANPHIDAGEIDEMRQALPALVARQEIDAEFVELAGALFKREQIRIVESEPHELRWVRSWDLAFTTKSINDRTACTRLAMGSDGTIIVAHAATHQLEWPEAVKLITETARADGRAVMQGIEVVAAQRGMLQTLLRDPALAGYSLQPIEVHKDKVTRALPLLTRAEQGKLAIVRGPWNNAFVDELCAFPEGRHDDQVDAATGALTMLSTPTGAISASSIKQIRYGSNHRRSGQRPVFTPRTLAAKAAFQGFFET